MDTINNTIFDDLRQSSLLLMSLMGVRTLLERELELKDLVLASEDSAVKELQRRKMDPITATMPYPYAYLSLSEMTAVKDHGPNKLIRRHGFRMGTTESTRATSKKGYIFPVVVQISLHYLDNDPIRVLKMAEALIILGQIGPLAFSLLIGEEGMDLDISMEIPETATIPIAETENIHAPDSQELEIPLIVHTYAGFFRDVSAVNSSHPILSIQLKENYLPTGEE